MTNSEEHGKLATSLRSLFENVAVGIGGGAALTAAITGTSRPMLTMALAFGVAYLLKR